MNFFAARLGARNTEPLQGPRADSRPAKRSAPAIPWSWLRGAHCALLRVALTFRITRLYEVRVGEPLSVTARIMWATPEEHGLFAGAQFGRHAAVAVAMARGFSPCEIVTAAMFCPGTKPASA